jgi:hypothetical protein
MSTEPFTRMAPPGTEMLAKMTFPADVRMALAESPPAEKPVIDPPSEMDGRTQVAWAMTSKRDMTALQPPFPDMSIRSRMPGPLFTVVNPMVYVDVGI